MARILVADDDPAVLDFLARTLERAGHEVERAEGGPQACARLDARSFHVLVTDLKMPGLDGLELLRRTRTEQPEIEVLVLTAHGSVATAVEAMKLGAFDYLEIPLGSPDELRLIVDRALERRGLRDLAELVREPPGPTLTWGAPSMVAVESKLQKLAPTPATVLLLGESGTGKEVVARAVHQRSARAAGPFVAVSCAVLSEQFLADDLFGHERGAFTGATAQRRGWLELAEGGTLFLDEVGELRPDLQAKLLRVLEEKPFTRLGGARTIQADVRWISATNRDLPAEVRAGRFRLDLYHRLSVFSIRLPPLRERREDIPPLADALLSSIGRELGRTGLTLDDGARQELAAMDWPGNARELRNVLMQAAILARGPRIGKADLDGLWDERISLAPPAEPSPGRADESVDGYCRRFITDNQESMSDAKIAGRLGMTPGGLSKMRRRLGIPRP